MSINYCNYCDRHFKFKDLYDQHIITCEFFYRKKRETDRALETFEHIPTPQEMYKLVQHLTLQCCKLQKEVDKLKSNAGTKTRKLIIENLNNSKNPVLSFEEWLAIKRDIKQDYLTIVYQEDLTAGIKKYINDLIISETTNIPLRTFAEKPNVIYVYSASDDLSNTVNPTWKIMQFEQFMKWTNRLAHRFSQEFSIMQSENSEKMNSSESEKDKNIIFMMKINGGKVSSEKRANDIKRWLISSGNLKIM